MEWNSTFKKMIAFLAALIMQSFFVFPVQADHETPVHDRSFYNDLEIESRVEYPDGWLFILE